MTDLSAFGADPWWLVLAKVLAVFVFLVVTVLGGFALGWLRHRTGSVLAPIGLHLGTNAVGLVAAGVALAH